MTIELASDAAARSAEAAGEAGWLERIIRLHERRVLMTAYRLLGRMEDAQDAAQQVFYRLYKYRRRLAGDLDPAPLLYRMTVNVCADQRRKVPELPLEPTFDVVSKEPSTDAALESKSDIRRCPVVGKP